MKKIVVSLFLLFIFNNVFAHGPITELSFDDSLLQNITNKDFRLDYYTYVDILKYKLKHKEDYKKYLELTLIEADKFRGDEKIEKYISVAINLKNYDKLKDAKKIFTKGLGKSQKLEYDTISSRINVHLGDIERYQANYIEAVALYLLAMEYLIEVNEPHIQVRIYSKIALAYKELGDYDSAMDYLLKAKEILGSNEDEIKMISILSQISSLHKRQRKWDLAEEYAEKAFQISKKNEYLEGILSIKGNLAVIKMYRGKYQEAIEDLHYVLSEKVNDPKLGLRFDIKVYNLLCEAYTDVGNFEKAEYYGLLGVKNAEENNYRNSAKVSHERLSELYSKFKDYKKALEHYIVSQQIDSEIIQQSALQSIKELHIKYETEEKERQIGLLKKEQKIKNIRLVGMLLATILLLVIIIFITALYRVKSMTAHKLKLEVQERINAESKLADKTNLLKNVIDSLPVHLFLKNSKLQFEMVNKTMIDFYHLTDREFIGNDLSHLISKLSDRSKLLNKCNEMDIHTMESLKSKEFVTHWTNPTTKEIQWFNTKTKTIMVGKERKLLGIAQDITQLKVAQNHLEKINYNLEEAVSVRTTELRKINAKLVEEVDERIKIGQQLRKSEQQYRTLLQNLPQRIFYKNLDFQYLLCNHSFAEELGLPIEEIIGKSDYDFFPKSVADQFRKNDEKVIEDKEIREFEERYINNGEEQIFNTIKVPIFEQNRVSGILGIFWDITEQRKVEQQLLYAERISGIGELAGGVAHEIKNPLSNISSAIQLLEEDLEESEEFKSLINIIHDSVADASNTIRRLIDFGAPQELKLKNGDIYAVLKLTCNILRTKLIGANIIMELIKDGEFPMMKIDEVHLKSAFMNIIINAIQAMPKGGKLIVRAVATDSNITINFIDNGCGIDKRNLQKIFDPFYTTKAEGTGLGMGLVHMVIKFHNGTINIKSEVDVGTDLRITLPLI